MQIRFNNKKSCLLHIANSFNKKTENLQLNGQDVCWFEKIKYLIVYIVSGKYFTVDVSTRIRIFYASANAILHNTKYVNKLPRLSLCESFVSPILTL